MPAVVLKLHPNAFHHGSLAVARTLGRMGVPVVGVHEDRWAPAAWSRHAAAKVVWRPAAAPEAVVDGLHRLAEQIGRPSVLVPTDDAGALLVAEHAAELRPHFLLPQVDAGLPRRLADKALLHETCLAVGFGTAQARVVDSMAELLAATRGDGPYVIKVAQPWLLPKRAGVSGTAVVPSSIEAREHYARLQAAGVAQVLCQEYLPAETSQDWYVSAYCATGGRPLACFTARKLRSWPPTAGFTTLGRTLDSPALRDAVASLTTAIGYAGVLDMDVRYDQRDGRFKLLDFNPRVGANFRTFEDAAGTDVVRALYRDLTRSPGTQVVVEPAPARQRALVVEAHDLASSAAAMRSGRLGVRPWLRSLHGPRETAWWAADDPVPFVAMVTSLLGRAVIRRRERAAAPSPVAVEESPALTGMSGNAPMVRWNRTRISRQTRGSCCEVTRDTVDSR